MPDDRGWARDPSSAGMCAPLCISHSRRGRPDSGSLCCKYDVRHEGCQARIGRISNTSLSTVGRDDSPSQSRASIQQLVVASLRPTAGVAGLAVSPSHLPAARSADSHSSSSFWDSISNTDNLASSTGLDHWAFAASRAATNRAKLRLRPSRTFNRQRRQERLLVAARGCPH